MLTGDTSEKEASEASASLTVEVLLVSEAAVCARISSAL